MNKNTILNELLKSNFFNNYPEDQQLEALDAIYELAKEDHLNYRESTRFTVTIVDPKIKDADIYANHKTVEEGLSDEQMMTNTLNNKNLSPNEADVIVFPFENVI